MFEARVSTAKSLKNIFNRVSKFSENINLHCNSTGIEFQVLNEHVTVLLVAWLKNDFFSFYQCNSSILLGFSLSSLLPVIEQVDDATELKMEKRVGTNSVCFSFGKEEVLVSLINLNDFVFAIPPQTSTFQFSSGQLGQLISDFTQSGPLVGISTTEKELKFRAEKETDLGTIVSSCRIPLWRLVPSVFGQERKTTKMEMEITTKTKTETKTKKRKRVETRFASHYLKKFIQPPVLSENAFLELTPNLPLILGYFLAHDDQSQEGKSSSQKKIKNFEKTVESLGNPESSEKGGSFFCFCLAPVTSY